MLETIQEFFTGLSQWATLFIVVAHIYVFIRFSDPEAEDVAVSDLRAVEALARLAIMLICIVSAATAEFVENAINNAFLGSLSSAAFGVCQLLTMFHGMHPRLKTLVSRVGLLTSGVFIAWFIGYLLVDIVNSL